ncbi:MAG TPA: hypothetical protein VF068_07800 [Rubrobacter sp.]
MENRILEGHEMMHGQAVGWEFFDAFGPLLGLLLLAGLLALTAWYAYQLAVRLRVGARVDPAVVIVRERLARGEVSADEYESTLEVLRKSQPQEQSKSLRSSDRSSNGRTYEDYVREAMNRLRLGRSAET